jgi:hypothetical protein
MNLICYNIDKASEKLYHSVHKEKYPSHGIIAVIMSKKQKAPKSIGL